VTIEPFTIRIDDSVLDDLRSRIRATRWPDQIPGIGWEQGTELGYLRDVLAYWADGFDWRTQERHLNMYQHRRLDLDGTRIHVVHERAAGGGGIPLILTHGWPSSFIEYLPLVPLLTNPPEGPAFDVVLASLPGYGFSERPPRVGVNYRYVSGLWHRLMNDLGYERYGVHGGDFGAGVSALMALDRPEAVLGLHLATLELGPQLGPDSAPLSAAEQAYLARERVWLDTEHAYSDIQATKPQSLGYGLNDSPAGLAAWVLEKWRSWTDSGGDLDARFPRDLLLTMLTVTWATGSITSSLRDDRITVPTGVAVFGHHFVPEGEPPRSWAERLYHVTRWTPMPRGGHFPAAEEPELLANDIRAFFAEVS
jgi:pimeloyl-ACP methyl ester carboxylesterase